MRILHLANGNMFGGIETFLVTLARLEVEHDAFENHFLLSHRGRLLAELEALSARPLVVEGVRLRNPWSVRHAREQCRLQVLASRPDAVVAHGPWSYVVFGQGLPTTEPLFFFQHGIAQRDPLHFLAARRAPLGVIAASSQTASTTHFVFPGIDACICPLPVLLRRPVRARNEVRSEFHVSEEPVIVNVARLESGKGHSLLLEALGQLLERRWTLWIVGAHTRVSEERLRRDLEARARALGFADRVRFLGERADVPDLLNAADIFCQPSTEQEGFGIALLEAMGAGLPLVVTDQAAVADPVGPDIGRRVPPSPRPLAVALNELLVDEQTRRRLGTGALARFNHEHQPVTALAHLRDTLTKLCARTPSVHAKWA